MKQGKPACPIGYFIAGWLCLGISSVAKADSMAYMSTNNLGDFGVIDLNTGVFSKLGNSGQELAGLGVATGALYGASQGNGTLFTVNPTNGALTQVGTPTTLTYEDFGSTTTGLYAVDVNSNLYSINPTTGVPMLIGSTGIANIGAFVGGLSTNSGSLYLTSANQLYTLNTGTGAATLIGGTGAFAISAMVDESGVLFGGGNPGGGNPPPPEAVYTIDPTTGAATFVADVTGEPTGDIQFFGLAPDPLPVPVPAPPIGRGPPVLLAVGGVLLGVKFLERSRDRRSLA
jgi:hypothetical protein